MADSDGVTAEEELVPAIPVSAGALIFDRVGRLLILKPTYKTGWTIPGGVMEADGETPWDACRREVLEECGIEVSCGRLACMDFRHPRPGRPGGVRYLFDCGQFSDETLAAVVVQAEEVAEFRLAALSSALGLLRGPIRRRVRAATRGKGLVYLEDGRPVPGVGSLACRLTWIRVFSGHSGAVRAFGVAAVRVRPFPSCWMLRGISGEGKRPCLLRSHVPAGNRNRGRRFRRGIRRRSCGSSGESCTGA